MSTAEQSGRDADHVRSIPHRMHEAVLALLQAKLMPEPNSIYQIRTTDGMPVLSVELLDGDLVSVRLHGNQDVVADEANGGTNGDLQAIEAAIDRLSAESVQVVPLEDRDSAPSQLAVRRISLRDIQSRERENG